MSHGRDINVQSSGFHGSHGDIRQGIYHLFTRMHSRTQVCTYVHTHTHQSKGNSSVCNFGLNYSCKCFTLQATSWNWLTLLTLLKGRFWAIETAVTPRLTPRPTPHQLCTWFQNTHANLSNRRVEIKVHSRDATESASFRNVFRKF